MALADDIALLATVPLFEDFDEGILRLIAFGSQRRTVVRNRPLFQQGKSADGAFVVMSGRFRLMRRVGGGKMEPVGEAGPGDLLGELAIISAVERKVTAVAVEDSETMSIPRSMFRRIMEEYPPIAELLRRRVGENLDTLLAKAGSIARRPGTDAP